MKQIVNEFIKRKATHKASFEDSVMFGGMYKLIQDPLTLADGTNQRHYHDLHINVDRKAMSVRLLLLKCSEYEQNLQSEYMFSTNNCNTHVRL